ALHLAELLRAGLHSEPVTPYPERRWTHRPQPPTRAARLATIGLLGLAVLAPVVALVTSKAR
ncbi:hypothetical protein, partial [Salinispora arenicola]